MNAARQISRRIGRAMGARTLSASFDCIGRTVSFGPDPLVSHISSFHLSRDYSERYQLTCVYLAMKRDDSDGKSENVKSVVYQSLFSRSDTGLLKGDHAMKMPTVTELIKPKES